MVVWGRHERGSHAARGRDHAGGGRVVSPGMGPGLAGARRQDCVVPHGSGIVDVRHRIQRREAYLPIVHGPQPRWVQEVAHRAANRIVAPGHGCLSGPRGLEPRTCGLRVRCSTDTTGATAEGGTSDRRHYALWGALIQITPVTCPSGPSRIGRRWACRVFQGLPMVYAPGIPGAKTEFLGLKSRLIVPGKDAGVPAATSRGCAPRPAFSGWRYRGRLAPDLPIVEALTAASSQPGIGSGEGRIVPVVDDPNRATAAELTPVRRSGKGAFRAWSTAARGKGRAFPPSLLPWEQGARTQDASGGVPGTTHDTWASCPRRMRSPPAIPGRDPRFILVDGGAGRPCHRREPEGQDGIGRTDGREGTGQQGSHRGQMGPGRVGVPAGGF